MPIVSYAQLANATLDYVIVGGGTAGLALAARLTENRDIQVLVVEAGADHGDVPEIDTPGNIGRTIGNPTFDWKFVSVPQKHAHDRVVIQPRGKGLGGSSFMNYLIMLRPSKEELDALEQDFGNEGWNWESLLHYMKKGETLQPSGLSEAEAREYAAQPNPDMHGKDGPLKVSFPCVLNDMHRRFFDAAERLGVPRNPGAANGTNDGSVTSLLSLDNLTGRRSYAVDAYLAPALPRPNLLVLTHAQVTRVLFETDGPVPRATGVEFVQGGQVLRVEGVRRDVVLTAGTLQTPHLLELSGIGGRELLTQHGIGTLVDLPGVGENMQDHVGIATVVEVETEDDTMDALRDDPAVLEKHTRLYQEEHSGLLATVPVPAFVFPSADFLGNRSDIDAWKAQAKAQCTDSLARAVPALRAGLDKQYEVLQKLLSDEHQVHAEFIQFNGHQPNPNSLPEAGKRYSTIICLLTHPFSRGSVHAASGDALAAPAIDPNYFAHPADLELAVHMVEGALALFRTAPLRETVRAPKMPPAAALARGRDGLRDFVRDNCRPVYHPVGTAAMMPREQGGVVDAQLRVYGTSGLRVADLSVMPLELSCHTQSVAYAIGEKAADMLKAEWS